MDRRRTLLAGVTLSIVMANSPTTAQAAETDTDRDWPWWGGPRWDWKPATPELADNWPESGPPVVWRRPLGDGYGDVRRRRQDALAVHL